MKNHQRGEGDHDERDTINPSLSLISWHVQKKEQNKAPILLVRQQVPFSPYPEG